MNLEHKVQLRKRKIQNIPLTAKFRTFKNPLWCQQASKSVFSLTRNCPSKQQALTPLLSEHSRTGCATGDPLWSWGWGTRISRQPSCSLSCPACSQRWEPQPSVNPGNDSEDSDSYYTELKGYCANLICKKTCIQANQQLHWSVEF